MVRWSIMYHYSHCMGQFKKRNQSPTQMCTDHGNVSKAYHDRNKFQAQDPSKSIMRTAPPDRRAAYGHIGVTSVISI